MPEDTETTDVADGRRQGEPSDMGLNHEGNRLRLFKLPICCLGPTDASSVGEKKKSVDAACAAQVSLSVLLCC